MGKWCLPKYTISLMRMPPQLLTLVRSQLHIHDDCRDFLEEQTAASLRMYHRRSDVHVVLIRSIEAACIVNDDRGHPHISSYCEQLKAVDDQCMRL